MAMGHGGCLGALGSQCHQKPGGRPRWPSRSPEGALPCHRLGLGLPDPRAGDHSFLLFSTALSHAASLFMCSPSFIILVLSGLQIIIRGLVIPKFMSEAQACPQTPDPHVLPPVRRVHGFLISRNPTWDAPEPALPPDCSSHGISTGSSLLPGA